MGPGRRSGPPGCGQGVTGISCPLPRSPTSPEPGICPKPVIGGPSVHQPCIRRKAVQGGAETRVPTTCPLCMEQACPVHVLLCVGPAPVYSFILASLEGENDQISIFFFFNEMLLLEAAQASLVIAMRGPQGAWAEVGGGGGVWDGISRPRFPLCQLVVGQVEPFLNPESASTSPGAHWPPSHLPAQLPACVPPWWCWAPRCLSQSLQWA